MNIRLMDALRIEECNSKPGSKYFHQQFFDQQWIFDSFFKILCKLVHVPIWNSADNMDDDVKYYQYVSIHQLDQAK